MVRLAWNPPRAEVHTNDIMSRWRKGWKGDATHSSYFLDSDVAGDVLILVLFIQMCSELTMAADLGQEEWGGIVAQRSALLCSATVLLKEQILLLEGGACACTSRSLVVL